MRSEIDSGHSLKGHLVFLTIPAWGCIRPLCGIASRAVQERSDIVVTLMTLGGWDERTVAECARYDRSSDDDRQKEGMRKRIRLVNIGGQGFDIPELISVAFKSFPDYYRKLVQGESVRSLSTGDDTLQTIRPTVVITDYNYYPILQSVREITGKQVPVWNWWSSGAYVALRLFGPEQYGGLGGVEDKARLVAEETGRDVDHVMREMTNMTQGDLVVLPGLPPFYDYEWYPIPDDSFKELPVNFYEIIKKAAKFVKECDAFIFNTCSAYDSEAVYATRRWLEGSGNRKLYTIGPMSPWINNAQDDLLATGREVQEYDMPIQTFMDKILASHGENSLLYLSFGSLWWPKSDYIRLYVEILLENEVPFIFAIASPYADLPVELIDRVLRSGIAMVSKWCPQQIILSHPVTGWFLSHCGHNSTIEAISRGVPIIAWPLMFDQPGTAAYISLSLGVAFELIEVRTGVEGLKRLHRGENPPVGTLESVTLEAKDLLRRMKGEEGDQKRRNAELVRHKISQAWKNNGDALGDFKKLLCDATKESIDT